MKNAPLLLCTDLDRTLIPNGDHPESPRAREQFNNLVSQDHVTLTYVTGRYQQLVKQGIEKYGLPVPAYVIADAGASIYQLDSGVWSSWAHWEHELCQSWKHTTHMDLYSLFRDLAPLRIQELEKQNMFKLSYYLPLQCEQDTLEREMYARIQAAGISAVLVWSVDEPAATGLLDVMPERANKQYAIEFLMQRLGFGLENTVFAGDSGNDLPVLVGPIKAILVANASEDVRQTVLQEAVTQPDALYLAQGGFNGMNGNYSAGILEGVAHYMPQMEGLLGR